MFQRDLQPELLELAKQYPVVTVTGPRQSGKTTLVRYSFPNKPYVNLESLDNRLFAEQDPREFLSQFPQGAIIDEVQWVPQLLSYIQVMVDELQKNGIFILTGSHQFLLHEAIAQSLAGRTALLSLYPMSLHEIHQAGYQLSLPQQLVRGFYPRLYKEQLHPTKAYRNYFHTYVERDVRQLINIKDINLFNRFIRLCAGRVGNVLNQSSLANDVGVSSHTINQWLSILEASYLIIRLQPYYENFGKRMIKAPKIYFTDVGLACYLLGIETENQVQRDPLRGSLVENLVILELIKQRTNQGLDPNLYYYRDSANHEIDVIVQHGHELIPIEIKAAKTFKLEFLKNLKFFKKLVQDRMPTGFVIYTGEQEQIFQGMHLINYHSMNKLWQEFMN